MIVEWFLIVTIWGSPSFYSYQNAPFTVPMGSKEACLKALDIPNFVHEGYCLNIISGLAISKLIKLKLGGK